MSFKPSNRIWSSNFTNKCNEHLLRLSWRCGSWKPEASQALTESEMATLLQRSSKKKTRVHPQKTRSMSSFVSTLTCETKKSIHYHFSLVNNNTLIIGGGCELHWWPTLGVAIYHYWIIVIHGSLIHFSHQFKMHTWRAFPLLTCSVTIILTTQD